MKGETPRLSTRAILVELSLFDGSTLSGRISVPVQGRLTDILNDPRDFLPVQDKLGNYYALAKKAIKQVSLPSTEAAAYRGDDPYLVLGIREGASEEELKKAYHHLCSINHPDRVRGLGLGSDYLELANQNMVRINAAYQQILRRTPVR